MNMTNKRTRTFDKQLGQYIKQARLEQKLTYEELAEKAGMSATYLKQIENQGQIPAFPMLRRLLRALNVSADPLIYDHAKTDNLDYKKMLLYLSKCSEDDLTTILALTEAYLRTRKPPLV